MLLWHARVWSSRSRFVSQLPNLKRPPVRVTCPHGRGVVVPSSIIAEPVTAAQESTWSARSAASTNDVDADQRLPTIGNEECIGGSSTLNRTPFRPPESRHETGTNHRPTAPA